MENKYLTKLYKTTLKIIQFIWLIMDAVSSMAVSSCCRMYDSDSLFSSFSLSLSESDKIFVFLLLGLTFAFFRLGLSFAFFRLGLTFVRSFAFVEDFFLLLTLDLVFFGTISLSSISVMLIPVLFFNRDPLDAFGACSR